MRSKVPHDWPLRLAQNLKGGLVLLDPNSGLPIRIINFQYNPDTLSRTLQVQGMGENADRSEALRLKGPAVETIKVEAELDLTDQLEVGDPTAMSSGSAPATRYARVQ